MESKKTYYAEEETTEIHRCHSLSIDEKLKLAEQAKDWRATEMLREVKENEA